MSVTKSPHRPDLLPLAAVVLSWGSLVGSTEAANPPDPSRVPVAIVEDCPRGILDSRFCDRDGDGIADPPRDESRCRKPDPLHLAYLPVSHAVAFEELWAGFMNELRQISGKRVEFFASGSDAEQIEALRNGKIDLAVFSADAVPVAVAKAGFVPLFVFAREDGSSGESWLLVTRSDSQLREAKRLGGKTVAFLNRRSATRYRLPLARLKREFGLEPDHDYWVALTGKDENSLRGLMQRDYDAAVVGEESLSSMIERKQLEPDDLRVLFRSEPLPTAAIGVAHDLDPKLAEQIANLIRSYRWQGGKLLAAISPPGTTRLIPADYLARWKPLLDLDRSP